MDEIMIYGFLLLLLAISGLIKFVRDKGGEVIVSSVGGFLIGGSYTNIPIFGDEELEEEITDMQHVIFVSLGFISFTFFYFTEA